MKALFIGRFQPFHLGHLSVIKDIDNDPNADEIIIAVGSSQYSGTEENPYTFEERERMIKRAIKNEIKKPYKTIAIPDIHDNDCWVVHVKEIVGDFDTVYTGNDWVKELFEEKNYKVRPVDLKQNISATNLRKMIKENNNEWKKYVPAAIVDLICKPKS